MKKIIRYLVPFTLVGLLGSQNSLAQATTSNESTITEQCHKEAQQLKKLMEFKPYDKCAGDVGIAAAYLDAAAIKVRYEHFDEALVSLHYSATELREIAYSRAYCAYFASLVKQSIAKIISLRSQLDVLKTHAV